ncbi:MAG: heavy-metal-associated domain-containing protein [Candidatus Micrarchaeia archaeon]
MEKTIKITGMHCASCAMLLTDAINDVKGAKVEAPIDYKSGMAKVSYDSQATLGRIKEAIRKEGYKA